VSSFSKVFTVAYLSDVFISGGQPTITYNPRERLNLEGKLEEYLDMGHKILAITGPTKSGKTVFVRSKLNSENSCWISGGQIGSLDNFWEAIIARYDGFTDYIETNINSTEVKEGSGKNGGVDFKIIKASGNTSSTESSTTGVSNSRSRKLSPIITSTLLLSDNIKNPLIIDDFHYIAPGTQGNIIRYLKELIFNGLRVIIISVPHRAYDAVKVEKEMTGRLTQMEIPIWEKEELECIMQLGFNELNVEVPQEVIDSFAKESFGSPHLTQDFCYKFCHKNDIRGTLESKKTLEKLKSESEFFREFASDASKVAFICLSKGPLHRTDRKERTFIDGNTGDIYQAILLAIAKTGPKTSITYGEIKSALSYILKGQVPDVREITRVFDMMTTISKKYTQGEPIVEYDTVERTLHISDPFFAYYLRWGTLTS
jgi:hypothetical protein